MKKIKNVFLLAAMAVSAGFVGCNKEDDDVVIQSSVVSGGTIRETIPVGSTEIDSVTFEVKGEVLAKGTYVDGVLTITLPATLDSKYFPSDANFGEGVTVSDPNVKVYGDDEFPIYAYKYGIKVGKFDYGDETGTIIDDAGLYYADRDVTITGTSTRTDDGWTYITNFNVSLKKGWNKMFFTGSENETTKTRTDNVTTTEPSGLKWFFSPSYTNSNQALAAALLANRTYDSDDDDVLTFVTATTYRIVWEGEEWSSGTWSVDGGLLRLRDSSGDVYVATITNAETFTLTVGEDTYIFTKI
ncbi:hypothetical protein AGMMS49982_00540 [Bacteroidia bacterium]|nr:hypothetical protein AGMMS49982_00540 [Bacteroidia bacterium]